MTQSISAVDAPFVFLSYSHHDRKFVERLRADITQAGLFVWIDHIGLRPGTDNWEKAIRAAIESADAVVYVASENGYKSDYCQSELAVARAYRRKIYPVFAHGSEFVKCIPIGMTHVQYVDMRGDARYAAGLPSLLKALGAVQVRTIDVLPAAEPEGVPIPDNFKPVNPYKGLQAFTAEDRENFFGRSVLVGKLVETVEELTTERFLVVVGPSGAGKSSVVMAGLLPTLEDRHPDWIFLPPVVPGDRPLEALAIMFRAQTGSGAINDYESDLRGSDMRGLIKHTKGMVTTPTQRVVLFIDQFEELFTQTPPEHESERRQYIDLLTTAALDPRAPVIVVLTLRADFTDRALDYAELTRLLQHHTRLIAPLSLADLREVIEEPARHQHLTFDPDLVADLVFAVRDQVGALPLLQFTLDQLFQRRDGLTLTRAAYVAIGGLRGALAKHAEATYAALPTELYRAVTRWLFLRLIEPGTTEQEITRRRVTRGHLIPNDPDEAAVIDKVINTFVDARLLTSDEEAIVEVAHEAMLREWPTLLEWVKAAQIDLPTQKALAAATADWLKAGAPPDDTWLAGPGRLREFTEWAARNPLSVDEAMFIKASQVRQAELIALEERRKQELLDAAQRAETAQQAANQAANRAKNARRIAMIVVAASLVIAMISILLLISAQQSVSSASAVLTPIAQQVQDSQALNQSLQLAVKANVLLQEQTSPKLPAVLLSVRALKIAYSPQADAALIKALGSGYEKNWFVGHTGGVNSVAFSPDGRYALTGSDDQTARLWDVGSGQRIRTFSSHAKGVDSVAFSPDGRYALTGSDDQTARLWDVGSGQRIRTFSSHAKGVDSVAFSPDGRYILTGSADMTARLWEVETGKEIRTFLGHTKGVNSVAFSPDGRYILTGSADMTARLWDVKTGADVRAFSGHGDVISGVTFSPDGRYILTGSADMTARLWDVASGQTMHTFSGHMNLISSVTFSPDGRYILTGSADMTARLWEVETGQAVRTFSGHTDWVRGVAFSPDGRYVLTGSADKTAWLWEVETGQAVRTFSGHTDWVRGVAFSPDGRYVLTGSADTTMRLWEVETGKEIRTFSGCTDWVNSVAFSPDGRYAVAGSDDQTARLWEVETGKEMRTLSGHTKRVNSVVFSPDGRYVLTGSDDQTARLWEVETGKEMRTLSGHKDSVSSAVFSSDGRYALTGSADMTARLWDVATGQEVRTFSGHTNEVSSVAFSPDGHFILTGSYDQTARLWETAMGRTVHTFSGHTNGVRSVAFSPDGRYILTGAADKTAWLWDVSTGDNVRIFSGHAFWINAVAFSPDGRYILTGAADRTAWLWDMDYHDFIAYACAHVWRDFTKDERQTYGIDNEPTCPQFAETGTPPALIPPTATHLSVTLPAFTPMVSPIVPPTFTPLITERPTERSDHPAALLP